MKDVDQEEEAYLTGMVVIALRELEECREFAALIPEVRTNLVFAAEGATDRTSVIAIGGRITTVEGRPHAAGHPKPGASDHMARLIIEIMARDKRIRAGINFRNDPSISAWLARYCEERGWVFSWIDRSAEPPSFQQGDGNSMPWKVAEAIRSAGDRIPKIFYESGAVGKEPVSVLIGEDPLTVVKEMCDIARAYGVCNAI